MWIELIGIWQKFDDFFTVVLDFISNLKEKFDLALIDMTLLQIVPISFCQFCKLFICLSSGADLTLFILTRCPFIFAEILFKDVTYFLVFYKMRISLRNISRCLTYSSWSYKLVSMCLLVLRKINLLHDQWREPLTILSFGLTVNCIVFFRMVLTRILFSNLLTKVYCLRQIFGNKGASKLDLNCALTFATKSLLHMEWKISLVIL